MADKLESLEVEVSYKATTAASKINEVTSAVKKLSGTLKTQDAAKGMKKLGDAASKATSPLQTLLSSVKRIAFYRMIRSAIKAVTEALQEGVENVYRYSKAVGGDIAAAYDRIAGATSQMKNQLGAAWATLVATIEPILVRLINFITLIIEKITQLFAALSGKSYYLKATNLATEWAESTEKGSKAAKEWRNQLLGFDEINRLEAPSNGGGSDDGKDYGAMFQQVALEPWAMNLKNLLDELRQAIAWMNNDLGTLAGELETVGIQAEYAYDATAQLFPKPKNSTIQPVLTQVMGNLTALQTAFNNISVASQLFFAQMEFSASVWKQNISDAFSSVKESVSQNLELINQKMKSFSASVVVVAATVSIVISNAWTKVVTGIQSALNAIQTFASNFLSRLATTISNGLENIWQTVSSWASRLWERLTGIGQTISSIVSTKWDSYLEQRSYNMQNGVTYEPQGIFGNAAGTTGILGGLASLASTLSTIPVFGTGGFPEDGLFFANHSEMVGQFSNGRTAVANNEQIVEGIKAGVYDAVVSAMSNSNSGTTIPIEIDGRRVAEILFPYNRMVDARHGTSLINA